jgi:AcrR family transcriptional regulator
MLHISVINCIYSKEEQVMGPKIKFSKEQIIEVAFELACKNGMENVTLRKVAEKLGSSVAPIYVNFKDGNELLKEVSLKAQTIAIEMCSKEYTDMPFLNIGIGTLKFARDFSMLYNSLCFIQADYLQEAIDTKVLMLEQMKKDSSLKGYTEKELAEMMLKMSIFTHGLASMASKHLLPPEYDEAMLIELLTRTGEDIVIATKMKREASNYEINHN